MNRTPEYVQGAAGRGAELLDRVMPGWHDKVNLDRLDMSGCSHCVLAQLAGQCYPHAVRSLYDRLALVNMDLETFERENGFVPFLSTTELQQSWLHEIAERKRNPPGVLAPPSDTPSPNPEPG